MAEPLAISIACPGAAIGTVVRDAVTGQVMRGVERAFIVIDAETGSCFADLRFQMPKVDGNLTAVIEEDHLRQLADALGFDLVPRIQDRERR